MSAPKNIETVVADLLGRGFYSTAFQPIVDMRTDRTIGYESLLRGPAGTPLAEPGMLFSESTGLSHETLDRLDLAALCSSLRTGRRLPEGYKLFVNVRPSTLEILGGEIPTLIGICEEAELPPCRIVLELSETATLAATDAMSRSVRVLRNAGVSVALDDIGVRSPYLYHLLHLEPEYMKIDRVFVSGIDLDERKRDLLLGMEALAGRMGTLLIAEGVETDGELATLREIGIPYAQGFLLGRPEEADHWLTPPDKGVDIKLDRNSPDRLDAEFTPYR
jgi:EAL domain-containing protein (putative c-di-GMP-specific phosphodiesterase class I)